MLTCNCSQLQTNGLKVYIRTLKVLLGISPRKPNYSGFLMIAITLYGSVPSRPDSLTSKALLKKRFEMNPQCGYMETGFLAIVYVAENRAIDSFPEKK